MDEAQAAELRGRFVEVVQKDAHGNVQKRTDVLVTSVQLNDLGQPTITYFEVREQVTWGDSV